MYEPKPRWIEQGDSNFLMWGHVKVGEVTMGGNGNWYAYFRPDDSVPHSDRFKSLKDFPAEDLAMRAVERALAQAAARARDIAYYQRRTPLR